MGRESLGLLLLSIVLAGASREPSFIVFSAESCDFTLTGQGSKVALISMPGRHQKESIFRPQTFLERRRWRAEQHAPARVNEILTFERGERQPELRRACLSISISFLLVDQANAEMLSCKNTL